MSDLLNQYMPNLVYMFPEFLESIGQTLLMGACLRIHLTGVRHLVRP